MQIDTAPFEAYAVTCGVTFTFGGVKITNEGEVLNTGLERIPGLFAAGEMVGGIFYFNYPGASGLTSGAVSAGWQAAVLRTLQNARRSGARPTSNMPEARFTGDGGRRNGPAFGLNVRSAC